MPDDVVEQDNDPSHDEQRWLEFARRHRGNKALQLDPLYSLPPGLMKLVNAELPGLLTEKDIAFETDLAAMTDGGFFQGRPFGYNLLGERQYAGNPPASVVEERARRKEAAKEIRAMMAAEMKASGQNKQSIERYFEEGETIRENVVHRQCAYAGWLVTNPTFLKERGEIMKPFDPIIEKIGYFPTYSRSLLGEKPETESSLGRDAVARYRAFLRRWGLETFATWDLPVPMGMEINQILYDTHGDEPFAGQRNALGLGEAGVVAFAPWCILRDGGPTLREIARYVTRFTAPDHLTDWLNFLGTKDAGWGTDRYGYMLEMHRYYDLALFPRYGHRRVWRAEAMDDVLKQLLNCGQDSVRKLRGKMKRRRSDA